MAPPGAAKSCNPVSDEYVGALSDKRSRCKLRCRHVDALARNRDLGQIVF
jgi:hypothetical protein